MGTVFGKVFDPQNDVTKNNPGLPQFLHIRTQEIMPSNFDGIKFIFNKSIDKQFSMNHVVNITNGPDNGYRFGTLFTGNKEWKGINMPTLQGEINATGHIGASIIQHVNNMRFVTVMSYDHILIFPQLTFDWIGNNYTASISASRVTTVNYPEFVDCTYLKTVTQNLSLGVRGCYRWFNNWRPIPECLVRYESGPFGCLSVSISPYDMHLCHNFQVNENLRLGFMLNGQFRDKRSIGHFGYQFSCPQKEITVRGMVDSEWNVRSTVEKPMTSLPIILLLSASLNHRNNRFGLGCGVILNK